MKLLRFNREEWRKYLGKNIIGIIGIIFTIIGIVTPLIVAVIKTDTTGPKLSITLYRKFSLAWKHPDFEEEIEVYVRGKKAKDISGFYFRLQNTGNKTIQKENYEEPLQFIIDPPATIVHADVFKPPFYKNIDIMVTNRLDNSFELSKSSLYPGNPIEVYIILKDDPKPDGKPQLRCKVNIKNLEGLDIIESAELYLPHFLMGYFIFNLWDVFLVAFLTALLFGIVLYIFRKRVPGFFVSRFAEIKIAFHLLPIGLAVFWVNRFAKAILNQYGLEWWWWKIWWFPISLGFLLIISYIICLNMSLNTKKYEIKKDNG